MSKKVTTVSILLLLLVLGATGYFIFKKNFGTVNIPQSEDKGGAALEGFTLPEGFALEIFAKDIPGARVIEMDPRGRLLVSQTSEGKIVALGGGHDAFRKDQRKVLASGLKKPSGISIDCGGIGECYLYVAESDALSRYRYDEDTPSLGKKEKLMSISASITDRHYTRSLLFLPYLNDDTVLVSVGSSCDVCYEKDTDHASIISYDVKTGKKEVYAKGLRNAVFLTLGPGGEKIYATEMGRDNLGDNLPPDEINIIERPSTVSGQSSVPNFGWPICYGKNIHDDKFDKNTYIRNPCMEPFETPSFIDLPAHSAPLGLDFVPEDEDVGGGDGVAAGEWKGWPEEYWNNMLVAYHGSWNRSEPTGYKIVRVKMNKKGEYLGTEDFISGWLTKDGKKTGRPVDIEIVSGGAAYISDDHAGVIYRLFRK